MTNFTRAFSLTGSLLCVLLFSLLAEAEQVTLTLSQEQDGGDAGRACMYIHQGKAEYRIVQPTELCPSTLTVDTKNSRT